MEFLEGNQHQYQCYKKSEVLSKKHIKQQWCLGSYKMLHWPKMLQELHAEDHPVQLCVAVNTNSTEEYKTNLFSRNSFYCMLCLYLKHTLNSVAKPPKNVPSFSVFELRKIDFSCVSHGCFDVIFNLIKINVI